MKLFELLIVIAASLAPLFLLAHEINGDEYAKAASGAVLASASASCVAMYRLWKGRQ